MFTGAWLTVGTPAWLKHNVNPAETSVDGMEHVYEMPLAPSSSKMVEPLRLGRREFQQLRCLNLGVYIPDKKAAPKMPTACVALNI